MPADETVGDSAPSTPDPDTQESSDVKHYKRYAVTAIIGLVLVALFDPVRHAVGGAIDGVHDVVVQMISWDAGKIDDMKERVEKRPYWDGKPNWQNSSIDFLRSERGGLITVDRLGPEPDYETAVNGKAYDGPLFYPLTLTVDEVIAKGIRYDGSPLVVVGRAGQSSVLGNDATDLGSSEIEMLGAAKKAVIRVGNGDYSGVRFDHNAGDPVAYIGVIAALGRSKVDGSQMGAETAYFLATGEIDPERFTALKRLLPRRPE